MQQLSQLLCSQYSPLDALDVTYLAGSEAPVFFTFLVEMAGGTNGSATAAVKYDAAKSVLVRHFSGMVEEKRRSWDATCVEIAIVLLKESDDG